MNCLKNISAVLLASLLCFALGACGGDDNDVSGPTEAAVTFTLVGPAGVIVGAVEADLDLPLGFALATDGGGALLPGVVSADARLPAAGIILGTNYTPEALPAPGQLFVSLASASDFAPGAVFTVVKSLAANEALPAATDFVIIGLDVFDGATGALLPGYTLTVEVQRRAATL